MNHLHYAEVVRQLVETSERLEKACNSAAAAHDEELFKQLHKMRMEVWTVIGRLVKGA